MLSKLLVFLALAFAAIGLPGGVSAEVRPLPASALKALGSSLEAGLKDRAETVEVTYWIGDAAGDAWSERDARKVMPTASAIKAFYMVEFFAEHSGQLDQPLGDAEAILADDHPSISHFSAEVRDEIRKELTTASVRRIAEIMQGKTGVSNAVYNAAANLVTAHLGGPEKLTARIHARDPRFQTVMVRRYMLRDRTMPGDNEATAEALAALYQALASRSLNGIDASVMSAMHDILRRDAKSAEPLFEKNGGLSSDPLTSVRAGWKQTSGGPIVFVVMCRQPISDSEKKRDDSDRLGQLSASLRDRALKSAGQSLVEAPPLEHSRDSFDLIRSNLRDGKAVLLDVRDRDEWDEGHLEQALLVPLPQLRKPEKIDELLKPVPKDKVVYTHCAVGRRALEAGKILKARGYDVRPLSAGYEELVKEGLKKAR